nr:hypothetical protein HmN_000947100 [Hymenolepis microstoma]
MKATRRQTLSETERLRPAKSRDGISERLKDSGVEEIRKLWNKVEVKHLIATVISKVSTYEETLGGTDNLLVINAIFSYRRRTTIILTDEFASCWHVCGGFTLKPGMSGTIKITRDGGSEVF